MDPLAPTFATASSANILLGRLADAFLHALLTSVPVTGALYGPAHQFVFTNQTSVLRSHRKLE